MAVGANIRPAWTEEADGHTGLGSIKTEVGIQPNFGNVCHQGFRQVSGHYEDLRRRLDGSSMTLVALRTSRAVKDHSM